VSDRSTFLLVTDFERLEDWCRKVRRLFDWSTPFLVGSALTSPDYRDVDVRVILRDEQFDGQWAADGDPTKVRFINAAVSTWGQRETGLPIDFQVQRQSDANAAFDGRREPMGDRDWRLIPTSGVPKPEAP
jgi:hypothetical protein